MACTILVENHHRNVSAKLYWNRSHDFQEDFKHFLYKYIMTAWIILVEGHQRNISAKLYWNQSCGFWQKEFQIFLYRYIGKISPAPWQPCFLRNHDGLNNLGRGSPKEYLFLNYIKIGPVVSGKKVFKVSFGCHGNPNSAWIPNLWTNFSHSEKFG